MNEKFKLENFNALSEDEMYEIDGGIIPAIIVALIALGGACGAAGFAGGIEVGLNRKNRQ